MFFEERKLKSKKYIMLDIKWAFFVSVMIITFIVGLAT